VLSCAWSSFDTTGSYSCGAAALVAVLVLLDVGKAFWGRLCSSFQTLDALLILPQIAADNAVFGQTGPKVGSFDAGYGSTHMARLIGQKKAREMWFLARLYDAQEAMQMGLVNKASTPGLVGICLLQACGNSMHCSSTYGRAHMLPTACYWPLVLS